MRDNPHVRVQVVGWSALLLECDEPAAVASWLAGRREAGAVVATEIVPGERTVLLDGVPEPERLAGLLSRWEVTVAPPSAPDRLVEIPTVYDGEDLPLVARHWGVQVTEVVARHLATEFTVAFCGFAPGFGYLTGLPPSLAVPRLVTPRPKVPAGSVGLAGRYTGVYPNASPGGWLLIGRTSIELFNVSKDPPALLTPGTRVRFLVDA
jgi:KipI family sensor histidine kinase inhibitor